jgi:hypothetical protein
MRNCITSPVAHPRAIPAHLEAIAKPGGVFFVRDVESGHTHTADVGQMIESFGRNFTESVANAAGTWVELDDDPRASAIPEEAWEELPELQPITVAVRRINLALFTSHDPTAA